MKIKEIGQNESVYKWLHDISFNLKYVFDLLMIIQPILLRACNKHNGHPIRTRDRQKAYDQ